MLRLGRKHDLIDRRPHLQLAGFGALYGTVLMTYGERPEAGNAHSLMARQIFLYDVGENRFNLVAWRCLHGICDLML